MKPLLKDTPNKEYSLHKGQVLWFLQDHGNILFYLFMRQPLYNSTITTKLAGLKSV